MKGTVFTIGHADRSIQQLLALLQLHRVNTVADVRWPPYSQSRPQFDRDALDVALHFQRIEYLFMGKELGPKSASSGASRAGGHTATAAFEQGMKRIQHCLLQGRRIAVLGAEKDPLACHRGIFIAQYLVTEGVTVTHILDEHSIEDHLNLQQRVLNALSSPSPELALAK